MTLQESVSSTDIILHLPSPSLLRLFPLGGTTCLKMIIISLVSQLYNEWISCQLLHGESQAFNVHCKVMILNEEHVWFPWCNGEQSEI